VKVVVDTSVIGHYFFNTSAAGPIEEQLRRSSLVAPSFLHIEFRQVVWKHMRFRNLCDADARHILSLFEEIPIRLVPDPIPQGDREVAVHHRHAGLRVGRRARKRLLPQLRTRGLRIPQ